MRRLRLIISYNLTLTALFGQNLDLQEKTRQKEGNYNIAKKTLLEGYKMTINKL